MEKTQTNVGTSFHWLYLEIYLLFHVVLKGLVTSFPWSLAELKWPVDLFHNLVLSEKNVFYVQCVLLTKLLAFALLHSVL